ncbi:MAG: hypothetical protein R2991_13530 [Thermoanaerobaculia bacterium]
MKPPEIVRLTPGKRVLFLTKDPDLIRRQLAGELDLRMEDLSVDDLLDDINTDAMTPAWVCFSYKPEDLARDAYAGLIVDGERLFPRDALRDGDFEVIVSGLRKGVGSSRETAVQAEKWSGIRIAVAASFAPIHAANNVNQGVLMGDHAMLRRLQAGRACRSRSSVAGTTPSHGRSAIGRPLRLLARRRRRGARSAATGDRRATDDHGREDPGPPPGRRGRRDLRQAGDAVVEIARRRRLLPRVHHRAGAPFPGRGVR